MSKRTMETLKEILCKELDEYANAGRVTRSDLETVHLLTDSIKNIDKVLMAEEQSSGYSGRSGDGSYASSRGSYGRSGSYDSYGEDGSYGNSYSSRGRHYVRGHYSYGDNEMVTQKLEEMMGEEGLTPDEKNIMRRAMDILKK